MKAAASTFGKTLKNFQDIAGTKVWDSAAIENGVADETISNLIIAYLGKYLRDHSAVPVEAGHLISEKKVEWRKVFALALSKEDQNVREKVRGLKRAADEDALPPQSQRESGERPYSLPGFEGFAF